MAKADKQPDDAPAAPPPKAPLMGAPTAPLPAPPPKPKKAKVTVADSHVGTIEVHVAVPDGATTAEAEALATRAAKDARGIVSFGGPVTVEWSE